MKTGRAWRLLALLLPAMLACADGERQLDDNETTTPPFIESGDLAEIEQRGQLRVLMPLRDAARLPRGGYSLDFERKTIERYAAEMKLTPIFVFVESRDQLLPSLLEGKGDLVAANLTATFERRRVVSFTVPVAMVREQLVTRDDDNAITGVEDLRGRRIALRKSSSFWQTVDQLREKLPSIGVELVPEHVDTEELIQRVALGEYELTVADSNLVEACLDYMEDIRPALDLTGDRPVAWAVRPDSPRLLESLNRFLEAEQLERRDHAPHTGDLDEIAQRKVLRMLTRNTSATYFLWRGELMGFEYELVREFADQQGLRLEVLVPPHGRDLLPWLREGRGDLVAAAFTPTRARIGDGFAFTDPYNTVAQVVVARADEEGLDSIDDLAGRTLVVRKSSSYWETLQGLLDGGAEFSLQAAPEDYETEEIIARVANGEFDLTLSDSHILDIELTWREDVKSAFPLSDGVPLAWAVRDGNPQLLEALNGFVEREHRGLFYNVIYDRYFGDPGKIRSRISEREAMGGQLSPYDELVRRYAGQYGFDWRLIVSMMYQESRFDPRAQSFAGALGLMQLLPRTAEEFGFDELHVPENGIRAGVHYLDWVRDRFEDELPVKDRMWFTLAAYNAGPGHVRDARRLAIREGLNPNQWFRNVEQAMLLLARPQYASKARHGYCRCREPVQYVREVRRRYNAYVEAPGSTVASVNRVSGGS